MMQWNLDRKMALDWGTRFANQALANTESNLGRMAEDTNLAELFLSGSVPTTAYGKVFLQIYKKYEPQRVADGVTEADVAWYWSMPMLERELIHQMSNAYRTALSLVVAQSRSWDSQVQMMEKASLEVDRNTVKYGLVDSDELNLRDEQRPIPFELYKRIENYRQHPFPSEAKERLIKLDNQNAFIRQQLKLGAV